MAVHCGPTPNGLTKIPQGSQLSPAGLQCEGLASLPVFYTKSQLLILPKKYSSYRVEYICSIIENVPSIVMRDAQASEECDMPTGLTFEKELVELLLSAQHGKKYVSPNVQLSILEIAVTWMFPYIRYSPCLYLWMSFVCLSVLNLGRWVQREENCTRIRRSSV